MPNWYVLNIFVLWASERGRKSTKRGRRYRYLLVVSIDLTLCATELLDTWDQVPDIRYRYQIPLYHRNKRRVRYGMLRFYFSRILFFLIFCSFLFSSDLFVGLVSWVACGLHGRF